LCARISEEQSNATKSKATKSKAKKGKAKQRRLSVCLSMSYTQITTTSGIRVASTFRPIRPPRLASLFLSSPLLSFLIFVCRIGAEQSNSTKSKATKSKAKKSKAKQRRLSVCLPVSYHQTTATSGIQVACMFRPIRPTSPRLALSLFSSPLLSQLYVCRIGAEQSSATKNKTTKSKAKQRRLSVCLSVSYPQTTTTSGIRVACTFRRIRPSSHRIALPRFSSPLLSYLCV
jgi:hypothetical protein